MTARSDYKVRRDGSIVVGGEAVGSVRKIGSATSNWAKWQAEVGDRLRFGETRRDAVEAALGVSAHEGQDALAGRPWARPPGRPTTRARAIGEDFLESEAQTEATNEALADAYQPLPRPEPGRRSPSTLEQAYNYGEALGRVGVGMADYVAVTALTPYKESWWNAHRAGWRKGRRRAGHPTLTPAQRKVEVKVAESAS